MNNNRYNSYDSLKDLVNDFTSADGNNNNKDKEEFKYISDNNKNDSSISANDYSDERANSFLKSFEQITKQDFQYKNRNRPRVLWFFIIYFSIVTELIFYIIIDPRSRGYSDLIKTTLISGFFVHLIALFIIAFKYLFSPSKEYYNFIIRLFDWNYKSHKNDKDK